MSHIRAQRVKLFLSAVSSEFESYRRLLAQDLNRPELDVALQEEFHVGGQTTLEKLDDYIRQCDGVIHLIGKATGSSSPANAVRALLNRCPGIRDAWPDLADLLASMPPEISYTQWEAYLAIQHKRNVYIYCSSDFDQPGTECPRDDKFVYNVTEEAAQKRHYQRISAKGHDRGRFLNQDRCTEN